MAKPKALILTGYGINCDYETKFAFETAGGEAERVHINDLIENMKKLSDYQILAFPGGFSFGDDIASGRVLGNKFIYNLKDDLKRFVDDGKLVIGICNGFQVITKCGLITDEEIPLERQRATLSYNDSNRYEDRWVHLKSDTDKCVFTRGIEKMYVPVAHGEGKFFAADEVLENLKNNGQIVFRYAKADGELANGSYPENPNGAPFDIAGVCDTTGRAFGMMPHPERFLSFMNHPRWTAIKERLLREGKPVPEAGEGLAIFKNAVNYFE